MKKFRILLAVLLVFTLLLSITSCKQAENSNSQSNENSESSSLNISSSQEGNDIFPSVVGVEATMWEISNQTKVHIKTLRSDEKEDTLYYYKASSELVLELNVIRRHLNDGQNGTVGSHQLITTKDSYQLNFDQTKLSVNFIDQDEGFPRFSVTGLSLQEEIELKISFSQKPEYSVTFKLWFY